MNSRSKVSPTIDSETNVASSSRTPIGPQDVFISHRGENLKHGFAGFRSMVSPLIDSEANVASSSRAPLGRHAVFISHRGVNVKHGFADSLYRLLMDCGISCFLDKFELSKGADAREQVSEAVRKAKIQVPIFTEDYGTSAWCLDELVEIMVCKTNRTSKVFPVFFDVEPQDLRNSYGPFASNFKEYIRECKGELGEDRIERWERALLDVSYIVGFELKTYGGDYGALIKALAEHVLKETDYHTILPVTEPVGLDAKVEAVLQGFRFHNQTSVHVVLIYGESGIGKTTLAREIRRRHRKDFEATSFVESCESEKKIQKNLCKDLLTPSSGRGGDIESRRTRLKNALEGKEVLIVFDGLSDFKCVEEAIDLRSLCLGSLVLMTSRDQTVFPHKDDFRTYFVGKKYEMPMMDDSSALKLFRHHVFRQSSAEAVFDNLANEVVEACGGHPLCLEILGRYLDSMSTVRQWQEVISKLRNSQFKPVTNILRMSYNDLEENEQLMFLDVACFLIGECEWKAKRFWAASVEYWECGLERLKHRCLVKVDDKRHLIMHDHQRNLGRAISKRDKTRIWTNEDLQHLLENGQGFDQVRGIKTSLPYLDGRELSKMPSLHLLFLHGSELTGVVNGLEDPKLRWLKWKECPSETVAERFCQPSLALLDLRLIKRDYSMVVRHRSLNVILESHLKVLVLLRNAMLGRLDDDRGRGCMSYFRQQRETSMSQIEISRGSLSVELSGLAQSTNLVSSWGESLEELDLTQSGLTELPSSFGKMIKLRNLVIATCMQLTKLPEDFGSLSSLEELILSWTSVTKLPSSFGNLKKLRKLIIHNCENLKKFPKKFGSLASLELLYLIQTSVTNLPSSFVKLKNLRELNICNCKLLEKLPEDFGSLASLELVALYSTAISELPSSFVKLKKLRSLSISNCEQLNNLPEDFGSLENMEELSRQFETCLRCSFLIFADSSSFEETGKISN